MMELSRWRAVKRETWHVVSEDGREDSTHTEHEPAQDRADELNRGEQYARIGEEVPRS